MGKDYRHGRNKIKDEFAQRTHKIEQYNRNKTRKNNKIRPLHIEDDSSTEQPT
jgi:hypothetical protein